MDKRLHSLTLPGLVDAYEVRPDSAYVEDIVRNLTIDKKKYVWELTQGATGTYSNTLETTISFISNGELFNKIIYNKTALLYGERTIGEYGGSSWSFDNGYKVIEFLEEPNEQLKEFLNVIATDKTTSYIPTPRLATTDQLFSGEYKDLLGKPDLSVYATKEELPNLDPYAKTEDVAKDIEQAKADVVGGEEDKYPEAKTLVGLYNTVKTEMAEGDKSATASAKTYTDEQIEQYKPVKATKEAYGTVLPGTGLGFDSEGRLIVLQEAVGDISIDWAKVINKPSFAGVATSGDYNDLINTPDMKKYALKTDIGAELAIASATVLGGVKIDTNTISVGADGTISAKPQIKFRVWAE